jgi:hypothetical protein
MYTVIHKDGAVIQEVQCIAYYSCQNSRDKSTSSTQLFLPLEMSRTPRYTCGRIDYMCVEGLKIDGAAPWRRTGYCTTRRQKPSPLQGQPAQQETSADNRRLHFTPLHDTLL